MVKLMRTISYSIMAAGIGVMAYFVFNAADDPRDLKLKEGPVRYTVGAVTEVHTRARRRQLPVISQVSYSFRVGGRTFTGESDAFRFFAPSVGEKVLVVFHATEPHFNRYEKKVDQGLQAPAGGWTEPPGENDKQ